MSSRKTKHLRVDAMVFIPELKMIAAKNNMTMTEVSAEIGRLLKMKRINFKKKEILF